MKKKWEREAEGAKGRERCDKGKKGGIGENDVEMREGERRGQKKGQNEGERKREERGERGKSPKAGLPRSCVRGQLRVVSG